MDKMELYNKLPIWGQNLACYAEGMHIKKTRYGKAFWSALSEYESHNNWSYEQLCEYRDNRLRRMIQHCYKTVPYYTKLFREGGINPDSIRTLDDLKVLPILTKDEVNRHPEDFISSLVPRKKQITGHTSGTTGSGFVFKTTQEAICEQWAVWWRYRRRLGIEVGTLSANFGTRLIVPASQNLPPFWRYNSPCHQVYFSAFHESTKNIPCYIEEIKKKRITWIHGYPSILTALANGVIENNIELNGQIKFITIGAENLLSHQRSAMMRAFGVEPFQHYGMSEAVANFSEYPDRTIRVDEDFAAVEFIPENGTNRIVSTGLVNYAMPLLRWDTKDTASYTEDNQKGRIVTSIDGRAEDYITLPNGRKIGKLDHVFKDTIHLKEVQIRQDKDYRITILAVTDGTDVAEDIKTATHMLKLSLQVAVPIRFKIVDSISKSKSGKLRFVVSEIK